MTMICVTGYSAAIEQAARNVQHNVRQRWCTGCKLWRWDNETCCQSVRWGKQLFKRMHKFADAAEAEGR